MDFKKAIGFGVLIWILMFVVVSIFIGFNIYDKAIVKILTAIIGGIIVFIIAGKVKLETKNIALSYGIMWVLTGIILDAIITMRFNSKIFSDWSLWLGYVLVLLVPLLRVKKLKSY